VLNGCSGLLTDQSTGECYELAELNDREKATLQVDNGNPILLVGSRKFVCSCYQGRVVGVGEEGRVIGVGEKGRVVGVGEKGHVIGVGEKGRVVGVGEEGHVIGVGEESRVIGVGEKGRVVGVGEEGHVIGVGEDGHISNDFSTLSCRIVPECSGYQLIGYPPEQIDISIGNTRKSIPTDCIIW
jgi:hypothetical protein